MGPAEQFGLLTSILGIAGQIVALAERAERNREKCKQLSEHVAMIMSLMTVLQSQWTPDPVTKSMLENMEVALNEGKDLVESCQRKRTWSRVFKTQKKANKIIAIDLRISKILEQFHIANMILIVGINKESFFMNVLEILVNINGACRRLPENIKEEMRSSIAGLSNTDNMSPQAKRVLELLKNELAHGVVAGGSSSPRPEGKARASTNGDALTTEILALVRSIVNGAPNTRHNRDEIQQMASFVQLAGEIIKEPQYSHLSQNPETRTMLNCLKQYLEQAYMIILHNNQRQHASRITRVILCGADGAMSGRDTWQQPDVILKVAYNIEYYVHVLPVTTMRQMYEQKAWHAAGLQV